MDASWPGSAEVLALQALNLVDDARLELERAIAADWRSDQAAAYRAELAEMRAGIERLADAVDGVRARVAAVARAGG